MLLEVGDLRLPGDGESVSIINYIFLKIEDNLLSACNRITNKVMDEKRYFSRTSRQKIYNETRKSLLSDYSIRLRNGYGIDITDGYVSGKQKLKIEVIDFDKLDTLRNISDLSVNQDSEVLTYNAFMSASKACTNIIGIDGNITSLKIEELGLSVRAVNGLRTANIDTVGDLIQLGIRKLYRVRGLGLKSITELVIKMKDLGLDFQN